MSKFLKNHVQKITAIKTCLNLLIKILFEKKIMSKDSLLYMLAFYRPKKIKNWVKEVESRSILRCILELEN